MQLGRWCPVCNICWYLTENQRPTRVLALTSVLKLLSCRARASVRSSGGQDNFNHATINAHYRGIGTRLFHFSDFMLLSRTHSGLFLCPYLIGWPRFDLLSTKDDLLELELAQKVHKSTRTLKLTRLNMQQNLNITPQGFLSIAMTCLLFWTCPIWGPMSIDKCIKISLVCVVLKIILSVNIFQSIVSKCEIQDRDNKIRTFQKKKKKK